MDRDVEHVEHCLLGPCVKIRAAAAVLCSVTVALAVVCIIPLVDPEFIRRYQTPRQLCPVVMRRSGLLPRGESRYGGNEPADT